MNRTVIVGMVFAVMLGLIALLIVFNDEPIGKSNESVSNYAATWEAKEGSDGYLILKFDSTIPG